MAKTRTETDTFGPIEVAADRYWGAQTQRSLQNFRIGDGAHAAAADPRDGAGQARRGRGQPVARHSRRKRARAIAAAAQEVIDGKLDDHFPLVVWQTGSGTQTNMNLNEVIANRANEMLGGKRGEKSPVHPNDHVNMSQSSNDAFPTAMHIAAAAEIAHLLEPALAHLHAALDRKAKEFAKIVKIGRTHTQDATPLTLGQEFSGYAEQVKLALARVRLGAKAALSAGAGRHGGRHRAERQAAIRQTVRQARRRDHEAAVHLGAEQVRGARLERRLCVRAWRSDSVAAGLFKIANDIRFLGSGPRSGLGELILPENEPGSSIMPGKVNPTQSEALTMVCVARVRQPDDDRGRRLARAFRAQRLQAGARLLHAAIDPAAWPMRRAPSPTIASSASRRTSRASAS